MWSDVHRIIIKTGDKLVNTPDKLGNQYGRCFHELTEAWVRIRTY